MAATFASVADLTDSIVTPKIPGSYFDCIIEMTGDSSYPTGGYPFGIAQLQTLFGGAYNGIAFVDIANAAAMVGQPATTAYLANYDRVSGKVQLFGSAAVAGAVFPEVAAAVSVATVKVRMRVRFF